MTDQIFLCLYNQGDLSDEDSDVAEDTAQDGGSAEMTSAGEGQTEGEQRTASVGELPENEPLAGLSSTHSLAESSQKETSGREGDAVVGQ